MDAGLIDWLSVFCLFVCLLVWLFGWSVVVRLFIGLVKAFVGRSVF